MYFYDCKYVDVIPYRYGNDYCEAYRCAATNRECDCFQCELREEEADRLFREKENK